MTTPSVNRVKLSDDLLGDYVTSVGKLPEKLVRIADNQFHVAGSLSRAVVALRSMAALNKGRSRPGSENPTPRTGNQAASC